MSHHTFLSILSPLKRMKLLRCVSLSVQIVCIKMNLLQLYFMLTERLSKIFEINLLFSDFRVSR